jgi:hypothetical protein
MKESVVRRPDSFAENQTLCYAREHCSDCSVSSKKNFIIWYNFKEFISFILFPPAMSE